MPMETSASPEVRALSSKRRLYYSLGSLLFLVLCFAGLFAGYRIGFNQGYAAGETKYTGEQPVNRVYEVEDLVTLPSGQKDFDSLVELITTTVEPNSWDDVGGSGTVKEFATNSTFVILQREDTHKKIEKLLAQLRTSGKRADQQGSVRNDPTEQ
jgi:hypothetical protein